MTQRPLDVVCVGRAAVDLYGDQVGGRLEDMASFSKYLGGSPANTAVGAARLGLKPAMLTRVGDEHLGRFVRETLAAEGVDVSHVRTDPSRLTALAILGIRDRHTFPLVFYRENCADMGLDRADFDADFIGSATGLLISGTHLSQARTREACREAIRCAHERGTRVILDIDYRPVLWGLTSPGLGEQRFVASGEVTAMLQGIVADCALVVGTEEEIHIAGGSTDTLAALQRLRELTPAVLVVKRGERGCLVFEGAIPASLEQGITGAGFPIEVFNVLGAGDAFMAGFLRGWLRGEPLATCCTWANASGAIVVSRHGCAPAMASWEELQHFITHGSPTRRLRDDPRLEHLHRVTTRTRRWNELRVLAFDHRSQLEEAAAQRGQPLGRLPALKALIARGAREGARGCAGAGVILDDRYGEDVLPMLTGAGCWIARPVEQPGSRPLAFEAGANLALHLRSWPAEHVAKCLVSHHPDDEPGLSLQQLARLQELQAACIGTGHEFLVEVIPPRSVASGHDVLARALEQIYEAGVRPDWWKLPPPPSDEEWEALSQVIERHDPHCRGVLVLGLEAPEDDLDRSFRIAAPHRICRGFAVGRSIFAEAAQRWLAGEWSDEQVVHDVALRYRRLITRWDEARAALGESISSAF